ncbi:MAG: 50S ribosomal protein L25/general stress protein Ctc [Gammaproteobacteria bacterium]|nr:50S ribosomal protein L25/general stress protein Ctc [Gammaproteobacteria bacterium]
MADLLTIDVVERDAVGSAKVRRLRRSNDLVPGIVYGGDQPPKYFSMEYRRIAKVLDDEAFFSRVLNLSLDGKSEQVVLRELQRHPATEKVIHMDFLRVSEDRELQVSIPFHFINEENCVGVKLNGGMISVNLTEIEVSCLPRDLPERIEIDMESLDVGDAVHLSDLELPSGVSLVALSHGDDRDDQIVNVHMPRGLAVEEEEQEEDLEEPTEETPEEEQPTEDED